MLACYNNLKAGLLYYFQNMQYNCYLDVSGSLTATGTVVATWKDTAIYKNELFYIAKVPSISNTIMNFATYDNLAMDYSSGQLTQQTATCATTQLFTLADGPNNTCYLFSTSMCSNNVLTSVGNTATCQSSSSINPLPMAGIMDQQWQIVQKTSTSWFTVFSL